MPHDFNYVFPLEKIVDEEQRIIAGRAQSEAVDRQGEIIATQAVAEALEEYLRFPTVRFMHDKNRPIGYTQDAQVDGKGLFVKARIFRGVQHADEAWNMIKQYEAAGHHMGFSVGGKVIDFEPIVKGGQHLKRITKMALYEISVVDSPANMETFFEVVAKSIDSPVEKACRHINPDGSFKGGFEGCVEHFMECKGLKRENSERLCAYIGRKAGKIPKAVDTLVDYEKETMENMSEAAEQVEKQGEEQGEPQEPESSVEERVERLEAAVSQIQEWIQGSTRYRAEQASAEPSTEKDSEKDDEPPIRKAMQTSPADPTPEPEKPFSIERALGQRYGVDIQEVPRKQKEEKE